MTMNTYNKIETADYWVGPEEPTTPPFGVELTYNNRLYKLSTYEGTVLPLVRSGGCNLKYSHHPVAIIYELQKSKLFRHLTHAQLCALVMDRLVVRSPRWEPVYIETLFTVESDAVLNIEADPVATTEKVAMVGGVSCLFCDSMVIDGELYGYEKYKELVAQQISYLQLTPLYRVPFLCPECFSIAQKGVHKLSQDPYSIRLDTTNALFGLTAILEKLSKTKKGTRHALRQQTTSL